MLKCPGLTTIRGLYFKIIVDHSNTNLYLNRYVIVSAVASLGISLAPFIRQMYGWDEPEEICWYRSSGQGWNLTWQWLTLFGCLILGEIYCTYVLISVFWRLRKSMFDLSKTLENHSRNQARSNRILRKIAFRVVSSQNTTSCFR